MSGESNQSGPETGKHPDHFVAEWRMFKGLTQPELGALIGVSHSKISRIETGVTELKPSFLKKLAKFFQVPPEALLTINPMGEGRQTAEMLTVWSQIAPGDRDRALRTLAAFVDGNGDKKIS